MSAISEAAASGTTTTNYVWGSNFALPQLALERDTGGALIRRYGYGTGRISMTTPQTTAYYSTDAIGSVTELSGTGGALLGQYDTDPFGGNPTSSNVDPSVASNPVGFAGEYQDPVTGLYDLRARNYDPAIGRFLAPDPLGPQNSTSPYTYVGDNPLGYTDSSGMKRIPTGAICSHPLARVLVEGGGAAVIHAAAVAAGPETFGGSMLLLAGWSWLATSSAVDASCG